MYSITFAKLNGDIEGLNSNLTVAQSEKSEYEQLYKISEQKLSMLQELSENLRMENNRLRSSFDKVGQDSTFVMDKYKEMNVHVEDLGKEKLKLILLLEESAKEVNRLKAELNKKNEQLNHFNASINQIKDNIELENRRNNELIMNMETLNNQLKIKENENMKLDQYNQIAKMTIEQQEQKIQLQQRDIEEINSVYPKMQKQISEIFSELEHKTNLVEKFKSLTQHQDEKINGLVQELQVVDTLKLDLENYNNDLVQLSSALEDKVRECEILAQHKIELNLMAQRHLEKVEELETILRTEMNWKQIYNEYKSKVESLKEGSKTIGDHNTSALQSELDAQSETIRLKQQNLFMFSEVNEVKERLIAQQKLLKKKDAQIIEMKQLLNESDKLRDEMINSKIK